MKPEPPSISVIVAAGRLDLRETLGSLARQDYPRDRFEVIVVSDRERSEHAFGKPVQVQFVRAGSPNPAHKRNLGAASARGEILAFIDDDAMAPPDWLHRAAGLLEGAPELAGVGGPNLLPDSAGWRERLSDAILNLPLLGSGNPSYGRAPSRPAGAGDVHLVNLFVRRSVFDRIRGFNESVGYGGEDTEFVYQASHVSDAGFLFAGSLVVEHHRRPFGMAYLKQRYRLRASTARLALALPAIYARRPAFWLMAAAPAVALTPAVGPYLVALAALSVRQQRSLNAVPVAAGAVLHHLAYVVGFYSGVLDALLHPERLRQIRARARLPLGRCAPPARTPSEIAEPP